MKLTIYSSRYSSMLLFISMMILPAAKALFFGNSGVSAPIAHNSIGNALRQRLQRNTLPNLYSSWIRSSASALRAGGSDDDDKAEASSATSTSSSPRTKLSIIYYGDSPPRRVLIVMDGFCEYHGIYVIRQALERYSDVAVVRVLSDYVRGYLHATASDDNADIYEFDTMRVPRTREEIENWKKQLQDAEIIAVYCESDSGLADAEWLRQALQVTCQDDPVIAEWRRNKFLMNQQVAAKGLAAVNQELCQSLEQAQNFAATQMSISKGGSRPVIVKPYRGVASELVQLCTNEAEIEEAWNMITSSSVFGAVGQHDSVLVQEFLEGVEYAVDVVSRDGHHKVAAIWRYDKRPANGAPFCYFQTLLVDECSDSNVVAVCKYVCDSLDSLGVRWGFSHNEVIWNAEHGPKLVEVNCRQHNMDFCPLTIACIGYNAFDMMLEALFGEQDVWKNYPDMPFLRANGCMVHFVNYATGRLKDVHHLQDIMSLPSVLDMEVYHDFLSPGQEISPTIDIRTDAGWAQLINPNKVKFEQDYRQIVEWMPAMFEVKN